MSGRGPSARRRRRSASEGSASTFGRRSRGREFHGRAAQRAHSRRGVRRLSARCARLSGNAPSEPTPHEADPTGEHYAFEKRVTKGGGGDGFADVWKRGFFAWEYKGKKADLKAAYRQLLDYREDLESPPLLIVSDIERIEIHTNFTGLKPVGETITLDEMATDPSRAMFLLRDVFAAPEEFRPRIEPAQITEKAAKSFADIAQSLRARGHDPEDVAHFLDRILFVPG